VRTTHLRSRRDGNTGCRGEEKQLVQACLVNSQKNSKESTKRSPDTRRNQGQEDEEGHVPFNYGKLTTRLDFRTGSKANQSNIRGVQNGRK